MLYETAVSPTIWFAALCESGRCINSTKYLVDMLSNVKKKKEEEIITCLHAAAGVKFLSQILCL